MENIIEEWKELPDAKGYFISNLGRAKITRSKKHPNGCIKGYGEFYKDKDGYSRLSYRNNNGKCCGIAIHRLVAKMFIPKPIDKDVVNHVDNDRLNNRIDNLEWVTPKENVYHSYQFGKRKKYLIVPRLSTLTPFQISQIQFLRQYYSLKKISELFNVNYTTMKNISMRLKKLTKDNQQPSIYDDDYHMNEGSTTIPNGSTSQANGDGNALPTNSGEDIV